MSAPATVRDRAPGLHFPGFGEVAQLVEHTAENRGVAGSIPALATSRSLRSSPEADDVLRTDLKGAS